MGSDSWCWCWCCGRYWCSTHCRCPSLSCCCVRWALSSRCFAGTRRQSTRSTVARRSLGPSPPPSPYPLISYQDITTCYPNRAEAGPYFVPGLPHAAAHSRRPKKPKAQTMHRDEGAASVPSTDANTRCCCTRGRAALREAEEAERDLSDAQAAAQRAMERRATAAPPPAPARPAQPQAPSPAS